MIPGEQFRRTPRILIALRIPPAFFFRVRGLHLIQVGDIVKHEPAPYILDFLGLKDQYIERDFEDAILRELEMFLLELGAGFSFIARQKRIQLDGEDFYIDLLFYNRKLKRLVAVELKQGSFRAEYKGYGTLPSLVGKVRKRGR